MAFCTHCGRPVNAGASFCAACGASLAPPAPVATQAIQPPTAAPPGTLPAPAPPARVRPVGVTIIGVVMMIGAALFALAIFGMLVMAMFFGAMGTAMDGMMPWFGGFWGAGGAFMAGLFLVMALFVAAFAALAIATAIGVLNGKAWAWPLALVVFGLIGLNALGSLTQQDFSGILGLGVAGVCIWYFFQPDVKAWFGKA